MPAAEFGWAGRTPSEGDSLAFPGTKDCLVNSPASHFVFSVTAVVTQGVAEYTSNGQMPGITPTTIAGFPAFVVPGGVDGCAVTIDVADGQLLDVGWAPTGTQASPPRETQCANATKGAVGAMKVLGAS
ncbi:uncharacterized protein DUF3558 [Actinocrispum wychmicini]|uniref:Uncharacterized protein DUF3558 n=2 Tax=Actinocrispum wychmicini TaxID=1213861 RepID=A0A4R2KEN4_9PSEU|nr:uncharacterized protein DUF3558 [Actinocrispum wychmicini]